MQQTNNKLLQHKGYYGSIEYDLESKTLHGKLLGIKGTYVYQGKTLSELETDFKQFVEDYLYDCQQDDIKPQKPNLGTFNVRIGTELHLRASDKAKERNQSLNSFVKQAIEHELQSEF